MSRTHSINASANRYNFFFSLLGLKSTSDDAARSLINLINELSGKVTVRLYVLPTTCDEAKRVLISKKVNLSGLRLPPNLAEAAFGTGADTIEQKYFQVCKENGSVSAEKYFEPYIKDLVSIMRSKGVELYNADVEPYGMKQKVIDDIDLQKRFEEGRFKEKAKNYEKLRHDMILWHFVNEKRKPQLESPLEANFWIITLDYRFIGFDGYKNHRNTELVPICLHPATLIQMLQFFVPRTPNLEEAMLDSIRLPFISQDFDPVSERVTVSILRTLGRYQDVGDLQPETVSAIFMNNALRQKLQVTQDVEEQTKLVKDALIQEHQRVQQTLNDAKQQIEILEKERSAKDETNRKLENELRAQAEKVATTERRAQEAEQNFQAAISRTQALEKSVSQLEAEALARKEAEQHQLLVAQRQRERRMFILKWLALPMVLLMGLDVAIIMASKYYLNWNLIWTTLGVASVTAFIWAWLIDWRGTKSESVKEWSLFLKYHKIKAWIFAFLWLTFSGLLVNALWDVIKLTLTNP